MQHDLEKEAGAAMRLLQKEAVAVKMDPSRKDILIQSETNLVEAISMHKDMILQGEADLENFKAEIADLNKKKKFLEKFIQDLRQDLAEALYPIGSVMVGNRKVVPSKSPDNVVITDKSLIPEGLMAVKTVKEPDKTAIKQALENGEAVPGAELITGKVKVAI